MPKLESVRNRIAWVILDLFIAGNLVNMPRHTNSQQRWFWSFVAMVALFLIRDLSEVVKAIRRRRKQAAPTHESPPV